MYSVQNLLALSVSACVRAVEAVPNEKTTRFQWLESAPETPAAPLVCRNALILHHLRREGIKNCWMKSRGIPPQQFRSIFAQLFRTGVFLVQLKFGSLRESEEAHRPVCSIHVSLPVQQLLTFSPQKLLPRPVCDQLVIYQTFR